jgi:hypothetical protein
MPAAALATPKVEASAKILPIPGVKGSGRLGTGVDLKTEFIISGTEYGGNPAGPAPLTNVKVYFPKGTKITTKGFPSCAPAKVEQGGIGACPKKARAGFGHTEGFVSLGGERVAETVQVTPFFMTGGGLGFWIEGRTPTVIEKLAKGHWSFPSSGPVINVEVPLIESLPGAPDASATHIVTTAGGAIRKHGKVIPYGTIPRTCPKDGFPAKAELSFLGEGTVKVETKVPCPPGGKKGKKGGKHHGRNHSKHHGKAKGHRKHHPKGKAKGHSKSHGKGKHKGHSKGPSSAY